MPDNNAPVTPLLQTYAQSGDLLRRVVAGTGLNGADADDILQEVFLEATERPGEYRGEMEARRWLVRVTLNRCFQEFRRRRRFERAVKEVVRNGGGQDGPDPGPAETLIRVEERVLVQECLRGMDETLLAPLVLRYFCDMNSTEVGEALELNASTVRSRLRDARLLLARGLMERGVRP